MSSWEQREKFLVDVARRQLRGHKTFDLVRSHLVKASQISKGTVYNHFPSEADLMVAVATAEFQDFLEQAKEDRKSFDDPLWAFLYHHCHRVSDVMCDDRFVIVRVMPNPEILSQASDQYQTAFNAAFGAYSQWTDDIIAEMGEVPGFDRPALVRDFIRGTMINIDDAGSTCGDLPVYQQYCYALTHLLGHSDQRIPTQTDLKQWLSMLRKAA